MALSGAYVDLAFILDKLDQDFGFDDIEHNDIAEDIWDVIGYVSDPSTFERKFAEVIIADFRGIMPTDFYSIVDGTVMEKDSLIPYVESTDLMDRFSSDTTILADTDALDYSYRIIESYIYTGTEDTTVMISYRAFPTDSNLPLIPDHPKTIRAVTNYCAEKIAFKLFLKDKLSERKYDIIRQESLFTTAAYKTSSKIPSIDGMERLKNIHLNILRNPNMHDNNFKYLGTRSKVYSQPLNTEGLSNTTYFKLTVTDDLQTLWDRPVTVSSNNLETIKELGTWTVTLSGTQYPLVYDTNISYSATTDVITYVAAEFGTTLEDDFIEFTYNIQ